MTDVIAIVVVLVLAPLGLAMFAVVARESFRKMVGDEPDRRPIGGDLNWDDEP